MHKTKANFKIAIKTAFHCRPGWPIIRFMIHPYQTDSSSRGIVVRGGVPVALRVPVVVAEYSGVRPHCPVPPETADRDLRLKHTCCAPAGAGYCCRWPAGAAVPGSDRQGDKDTAGIGVGWAPSRLKGD